MPGWPGGDPGALREAATAWRNLATAFEEAGQHADSTLSELTDGWEGAAAGSFHTVWGKYRSGYAVAAKEWRHIADQLDKAANEVDQAHSDYVKAIAVAAATAVAGLALTIFSFGASDAIAAAAGATDIAWIASILTSLATFISSVAAACSISSTVLIGIVSGFVINFGLSEAGGRILSDWTGGAIQNNNWEDLLNGVFGGVGGGANGAIFSETTALTTRLAIGGAEAGGFDVAGQAINIADGNQPDGFDLAQFLIAIGAGAAGSAHDPILGNGLWGDAGGGDTITPGEGAGLTGDTAGSGGASPGGHGVASTGDGAGANGSSGEVQAAGSPGDADGSSGTGADGTGPGASLRTPGSESPRIESATAGAGDSAGNDGDSGSGGTELKKVTTAGPAT